MQQSPDLSSKKKIFSLRDIFSSLFFYWPSYVCSVLLGLLLLFNIHAADLPDTFPYYMFGIGFSLLGCLVVNTLATRSLVQYKTGIVLSFVCYGLGAVAGILPYLIIRLFPYRADDLLVIILILFGAGSLLLLLGIAQLASGTSVRHLFWILLRAILYEMMTSILSGGLIILALTVQLLIGIDLNEHVVDSPILLYTAIYPLLCFPVLAEKQEHEYPKFLYYFFTCGIVPLLAAFTSVFYVYLIRILVLQRFPSNEVAPLVLFGSAVGIVVSVFLLPQREKTPAKWFLRIFPVAWLLPLGMYFTSVFIRIQAYGFTPERVLLVLFGLWMFLFIISVLFVKKCTSSQVILSFALVFALAVAPPADLPFRLSKADQTFRLKQSIAEADLGAPDSIRANPSADPELLLQAISSARYLVQHTNTKIVSADGTAFDGSNTEEVFGVSEYALNDRYEEDYPQSTYLNSALYDGSPVDVSGMKDMYLSLDWWTGEERYYSEDCSISAEGVLSLGAEHDPSSVRIDLAPLLQEAVRRNEENDPEWYIIDTVQNGTHYRILIETLGYSVQSDGCLTFSYLSFHLLTAPIEKTAAIF